MNERFDLTPAARYAGVSSDRQDVDLSVAAQLRALRDYAEKNDYLAGREYIDEAESGRIADRPQFQKMLDEASKPEAPFKEILVWKFSRFTRKREHAVAFKAMLRRRGVRVVSITEQADDTPTGKLMEAITESGDEFYSENLAQEVRRRMRESAQRGFYLASVAPFGYRMVYVTDGGKQRPRLELDPPKDAVARRVLEMALRGQSILEIVKTLNKEGIPTATGKRWLKTSVHGLLTNEVYMGTLVWGLKATDGSEPVRVEDAVPAIVSGEEFEQVRALLEARAPAQSNPRSVASPYLLSGLVGCALCGKQLTGAEAKGGRYSYYVCGSLLKRGSGACDTPRLNARRFETLILDQLRDHVLTESNIRELVKMLDEEMDGAAREERDRLETIEAELREIRLMLDRIWEVIEKTGLEVDDAAPRIREHMARKEQLETAAEQARNALAERRVLLDKAGVVAEFAADMAEFLRTSDITESKAFLRSFIKRIAVEPGRAVIHYTIAMPEDSPIGRIDAAEVALAEGVGSSVPDGGPSCTELRTFVLEITL